MDKSIDIREPFALILIIVCIVATLALSGCTGSSTGGNGAGTPTVAPTAAPTGKPGGNAPTISSVGANQVVDGTGNADVKVNLEAGGYIAYVQARSTFQLQEVTPSGASDLFPPGQSPDKSGWAGMMKAIHVNESGEKTFMVITGGYYDLRFNRLPSGDRQYMPVNFSGKGTSCAGPVEISPGNVTVTFNCADTLKGPVTLSMVDGGSGESLGVIASSKDAPGTGNGFAVTRSFNLQRSGAFMVQVEAMGNAAWTLKVSR